MDICCNEIKFNLNLYICANATDVVKIFTVMKCQYKKVDCISLCKTCDTQDETILAPGPESETRGPEGPGHSSDLFNNVKIGQGQLQLIMKHILFYHIWGLQPFWSSVLSNLMNNPSVISVKKMFR